MNMSLKNDVCCQVDISASGWSLVKRNLIECGVSECDNETWTTRRPWPTRCWRTTENKNVHFLLWHEHGWKNYGFFFHVLPHCPIQFGRLFWKSTESESFNILLTVHPNIIIVIFTNLTQKFFILIRLLQPFKCFEHYYAHPQEIKFVLVHHPVSSLWKQVSGLDYIRRISNEFFYL